MSGAGVGGGEGDLVAQIGTRLSAQLIIPNEKCKASFPMLASRRIICGDLIADYIQRFISYQRPPTPTDPP